MDTKFLSRASCVASIKESVKLKISVTLNILFRNSIHLQFNWLVYMVSSKNFLNQTGFAVPQEELFCQPINWSPSQKLPDPYA